MEDDPTNTSPKNMPKNVEAIESEELGETSDLGGIRGIPYGLAWMGLVWLVSAPALLGAGLGTWVDHRRGMGDFRGSIFLVAIGLGMGCWSARRWIMSQNHAVRKQSRRKL